MRSSVIKVMLWVTRKQYILKHCSKLALSDKFSHPIPAPALRDTSKQSNLRRKERTNVSSWPICKDFLYLVALLMHHKP